MKITTRSNMLLTMLTAIFTLCLSSSIFAQSSDSDPAMSVVFQGGKYHHRWSKQGQNEFTPSGQADLAYWRNMLTVNVHKKVATAEQLAEVADHALELYQKNGHILRADAKPKTTDNSVEYFFSAVFVQPTFVEAAFSRFMLLDGVGVVVVYSQRFYGENAQNEILQWVAASGMQTEDALMSWKGIPAIKDLDSLPQS